MSKDTYNLSKEGAETVTETWSKLQKILLVQVDFISLSHSHKLMNSILLLSSCILGPPVQDAGQIRTQLPL